MLNYMILNPRKTPIILRDMQQNKLKMITISIPIILKNHNTISGQDILVQAITPMKVLKWELLSIIPTMASTETLTPLNIPLKPITPLQQAEQNSYIMVYFLMLLENGRCIQTDVLPLRILHKTILDLEIIRKIMTRNSAETTTG